MRAPDPGSSPAREGVCRRRALGAIASLIGFEVFESGCARKEPVRPNQVAIPLDDLAPGRRMIIAIAGNPIEVMRIGDRVRALMLRCTHTGCANKWKPELKLYVCPCHDGRYDENGNVVAGPPPLPLHTVPVTVSGGRVIVG